MYVDTEIPKLDTVSLLLAIWKWLLNFHEWNSWVGVLVRAAVAISVSLAVLRGIRWVLEQLASVGSHIKEVRTSFHTDDNKLLEVRQRQQFCTVLRSDLDVIAKAENWNDQWFTDLEAEVEAEGRYYRTPLDFLRNRRVSGYRKEPSLLRAIGRSADRCLLLVGEPGSGKSVALRHLARGLADHGTRSRSEFSRVPLYVNLRELIDVPGSAISVDRIQQFVLDNVRRGDADTAAYIREHWQDYKHRGVWFFLFDSFDEIPAVLHSASGSAVVRDYTNAIRQFMDGMGACKGVLASREFKGPEAIPWQKLRILALDAPRQDQLISNALLSAEQQRLVHRHLAMSDGTIFRNPLFLSLLCRYVRDKNARPAHDYDLVYQQVERLARRDVDHLGTEYELNPDQLLQGAKILAALLAQDDRFGLAPRWEDLATATPFANTFGESALKLLAALVDVKIGRADVKEAKPGDRRFAFSHRRYQETLFVDYLAHHPSEAPADLIQNSKWREYAVTFLQSQSVETCSALLSQAARLLTLWSARNPNPALPEFGGHGSYYTWNASDEVHALQLLHQGLTQRREGIPTEIAAAIEQLILPRWETGDAYDRLMTLRFAALLPPQTLQRVIVASINEHLDVTRRAAFVAAGYIPTMDPALKRWVCDQVASDTLLAENAVELGKVELLCAKLPVSLQAYVVFERCRRLRSVLSPAAKIFAPFTASAAALLKVSNPSASQQFSPQFRRRLAHTTLVFYGIVISVAILVISLAGTLNLFPSDPTRWIWLLPLVVALAGVRLCLLFICRSVPERLYPITVCRVLVARTRDFARKFRRRDVIAWIGIFVPFMAASLLLDKYPGTVGGAMGILYVIGMVAFAVNLWRTRLVAKHVRNARSHHGPSGVLDAKTAVELNAWITSDYGRRLETSATARSLLRLIDLLPIVSPPDRSTPDRPLFAVSPGRVSGRLKQVLLARVLELEEGSAVE
jgi:hypothetical protein